MRPETIAIHGGFEADPATKSVAVPIYQTASYAFDSAAHGAALFDLEVEGFRYTRIANPTTAVLEQRMAELEGGAAALQSAAANTGVTFTTLGLHAAPDCALGDTAATISGTLGWRHASATPRRSRSLPLPAARPSRSRACLSRATRLWWKPAST